MFSLLRSWRKGAVIQQQPSVLSPNNIDSQVATSHVYNLIIEVGAFLFNMNVFLSYFLLLRRGLRSYTHSSKHTYDPSPRFTLCCDKKKKRKTPMKSFPLPPKMVYCLFCGRHKPSPSMRAWQQGLLLLLINQM